MSPPDLPSTRWCPATAYRMCEDGFPRIVFCGMSARREMALVPEYVGPDNLLLVWLHVVVGIHLFHWADLAARLSP